MIIPVHIHTADTLPVKLSGKVVPYLAAAGLVHDIQPFVGTDVIAVLSEDNGIYYLPLHSYGTVYILKGGFGQPEQPKP